MCIQKFRSKISYFKCRTSELYLFINLYESHFAFCSLIFHLIKESRSKKKFLMPNKKLILHLNYYHSFKKFVFFFFSVTLRNVTEVLEFAMLYNASQLRDVCTELLTNNLATVIESRFVTFKVVCEFLFKNSA